MKQPQIDITNKVMSQITEQKLSMKPRSYFVATKTLSVLGVVVAGVVLCVSVMVVMFGLKAETFKEYFQFGTSGALQFAANLPWQGIVFIVLTAIGGYMLMRKLSVNGRRNFVALAVATLLVGIYVGLGSPADSPVSKIATGLRLGNEPQKITGTVLEISSSSMVVQTAGGEVVVKLNDPRYLHEKIPQVGDLVLILGNKKSGNITAQDIKVIETANLQSRLQPVKVEAHKQTVETKEEEKKEEPKPVTKPSTTKSSQGGVTQDAGTSAPVGQTISITSATGPYGGGPRKFIVSWTANFTSAQGYKLIWSLSPNPTYPGSPYNYYSSAASSGTGYVVDTLGPGTYYVKVCEYVSGEGCVGHTYSNQVTVTFP